MLFLEYRKQQMDQLNGAGRCQFLAVFQSKFELRVFQGYLIVLLQFFLSTGPSEQRSDCWLQLFSLNSSIILHSVLIGSSSVLSFHLSIIFILSLIYK